MINHQIRSSLFLLAIFFFIGCNQERTKNDSEVPSVSIVEDEHLTQAGERDQYVLQLPKLNPAKKGSSSIKVVATTSIVGDVVSQIGGQHIDLVVLMMPGQDPHSFVSSVSDLRSVSESDVIFVAGWNLEEGLISDLHSVSDSPQVPVSAGIEPRLISVADDSHKRDMEIIGPDPHTWLDPRMVVHWVNNISVTLSELDPANSELYKLNAESYIESLDELINLYDSEMDAIDANKKKLVTNHDALGYFADAYQIEVIGSILPSGSTLAEPSAKELANVVSLMNRAGVCTIFTETTSNNKLASAIGRELDRCSSVNTIDLYTGSLGPEGSEADTYLNMMKINLEKIKQGLQ